MYASWMWVVGGWLSGVAICYSV